ncbi:MAG: hypothetical protein ABFS38_05710 [Bacteroidota bacterium]
MVGSTGNNRANAHEDQKMNWDLHPNLLKLEDSRNMSIRSKRLVAAWDNEFLLKVFRKGR